MSRKAVRILVVDDEEIVRESLTSWLRKDGYTVAAAADGPTALAMLRGEDSWSVILLDLKMTPMDGLQVLEEARTIRPAAAAVIMTAYATVDTAVRAMKLGAYDYLMKPFDPEELSLMVEKIVAQQSLRRENLILRKVLKRGYTFRDLVSKSPAMQAVFELARAAAKSGSTVLILGESGTGKDLLARAIHAESLRAAKPFVAVSCAALTETLLESELFGHERGAFTGAVDRHQGKFEAAGGGTLFLDEIGDIGPKLQIDLLRVLEERKITRVGGTVAIPVDVRVVAATNRDLPRAIRDGAFRQDLYYRLNVIPLTLPPLRERKEDIPLLVAHLVEHLAIETGKAVEGVSEEAMSHLLAHDWPGNVRELRNVLERAIVLASGTVLRPEHLGPFDAGEGTGKPLSLEDVERRHIAAMLRQTGGNVSQAARVLDIDRATLYAKIRKYDLRREDDPEPIARR
ncbi:MAG TPA: sigma-54 dependent transcriptional regulator [Candidatus Polarisedimenticolaceae bacterium]|nr:sigma-54 dependent transcriptional regulator [Candidatus Polarisedimenticolaceae bacterium]